MGRSRLKSRRPNSLQFVGTLKELQTANWQETLEAAEQLGVKIMVRYGTVLCNPPQPPQELREAIVRNKTELIVALAVRSEEGMKLLEPILPVIKAAHRGELPTMTTVQGSEVVDLSEYICAIAAGIWYGVTLESPLLADWMENLRRCQAGYERLCQSGAAMEV
jgi:hypothetical protein